MSDTMSLANEMRAGRVEFSPMRLWLAANREAPDERERGRLYRHAGHHAGMYENWRGPDHLCPVCGDTIPGA